MQVLLECIFLGSMYNSFVRQDAQIYICIYTYIYTCFIFKNRMEEIDWYIEIL